MVTMSVKECRGKTQDIRIVREARGSPSRDSDLSAADYSTSESFRASMTEFFIGFLA